MTEFGKVTENLWKGKCPIVIAVQMNSQNGCWVKF